MYEDWSDIEVNLIVADYVSMLLEELKGNPVNKTKHRTQLKSLIRNRSDGSIEFKHQNISAVFIKHGLPFIRGYKSKGNYQAKLEIVVLDFLHTNRILLDRNFQLFADDPVGLPSDMAFTNILESPPKQSLSENGTMFKDTEAESLKRVFKTNYLEREQKNATLGKNGEQLIFLFEQWRLKSIGKNRLSEQVELISEHDDAAGYDILSKNDNGTDRYIEVKTTKLSKETPIYFSKNEYLFSTRKKSNYFLYRVFNFGNQPKLFQINGSFDEFCRKEATQFRGVF